MDQYVWDTFSFLFAGKAYAIFALLFGFTFFIQMHNQARKGVGVGRATKNALPIFFACSKKM
jgi:uncharacterized membrane protein YeiB